MRNTERRLWPMLALAALLAVSACGRKSSPLTDADGILKFVPADAPYVFGNVEPLPDDFFDTVQPKLETVLAAYRDALRAAAGVADVHGSGSGRVEVRPLAEGLAHFLSLDGFEEAGFTRETRMLFYGNGLTPVLRVEVADPARFEAAVARLENDAGQALPQAELGSLRYRYLEFAGGRVIVAVTGGYVVVSVAPDGYGDADLGRLLGLTLPAENIAEAGVLRDIAAKYGFIDTYIGFFDVVGIADRLLEPDGDLDAKLLATGAVELPSLSSECKAEFRSLAEMAPRLVIGYDEISGERVAVRSVFELRSDLAEGMTTVPAPVPGLGQEFGGLLSVGVGLDPAAARAFYATRIEAAEGDPFDCERLSSLNAGVLRGRELLDQPIMPMVYDFKGFLAVIDELEGLDFSRPAPPTDVDARFLLAFENPSALIALGALMSPELATLELEDDGRPLRLDMASSGYPGDAWVAMTERLLAIGVGNDAESEVPALLAAPVADEHPFFSMSMDAGRYLELISALQRQPAATLPDGSIDDLLASGTATLDALGALYDRVALDVYFTTHGIEIRNVVSLTD